MSTAATGPNAGPNVSGKEPRRVIGSVEELIPAGREAPVFRRKSLVQTGQSIKYPVFWLCRNPECRPDNARAFSFQSDYPECPKCGAEPPLVQKRALVHLLLRNPKGPILGMKGLRWELACDVDRDWLATGDNGEAATGLSFHVNCQVCLKRIGNKVVVKGLAIHHQPTEKEIAEAVV